MSEHPWRRPHTPAPEQEVSYVPTIADRLLKDADQHGIGHASAVDDAQDPWLEPLPPVK